MNISFEEEEEESRDKLFRTPEKTRWSSSSPMRLSSAYDFETSSTTSASPRPWQKTLLSPVRALKDLQQSKDDFSMLVPSVASTKTSPEGIHLPLLGEINYEKLKKASKEWLKNPKNLAVSLWGLVVGISGAILFLVMVGLLDGQLHTKAQRDAWFEVNNQILNALFTMMCLYLHPQRCLHLFMLFRWRPHDITKLREIYCKNGTYKPHEWTHMLVVVSLLQVNCFAQYALCGINLGYRRSERPAIGVGLCLAVAIGAPAAAGIYASLSPLAKEFQINEENDIHMIEAIRIYKPTMGRSNSLRIGRAPCGDVSFVSKDGALVENPNWNGKLFDCCMDPHIATLTVACPFCVFGWNMERLGFGNRYVHIVTFILLCSAPFWILTLAAINIDDNNVRKGLGISGIILSILGLLYGGFWRIQMRKTYKLPAGTWCFGKPVLTDFTQWLFFAPCSLCQEIRTSEYYKVQESNFYERREVSPFPSSRHSLGGAYHLDTEASSPITFRSSPIASFSGSSQMRTFDPEIAFENRERVFSEISNTVTMHPPPLQVFPHDKSGNF